MTKAFSKLLGLSILTSVLAFGSGYFMATAKPETLKKWGLYTPPVTLLVDGEMLLSPNLQRELEIDSGKKIKILVAQNYNDLKKFSENADLIIARTCWLERLNLQPDLDFLEKNKKWIYETISPDFLTFEHEKLHSIPLLWTFGKKPHATEERIKNLLNESTYEMTLIGMVVLKPAKDVMDTIFDKKWMQKWIETIPLSTTYMTLDEELIEATQKARFFRELDFRKIKKITPQSPDCDAFQFLN